MFQIFCLYCCCISEASLKEEGILEAKMYLLLKEAKAEEKPEKAIKLLEKAKIIYPNSPEIYFMLSKKTFSLNLKDISKSIKYMLKGFILYGKDFWYLYNTLGVLISAIVCSIFFMLTTTLVINLYFQIPLIVHNLSENPARLFMILLFLFSIFGIGYFFAVITFFTFWQIKGKIKKLFPVILFSIFIMVILGNFVTKYLITGISPTIKAVVGINKGRSMMYNVTSQDSFILAFSKAIRLQKTGKLEEAIDIYEKMLNRWKDPRVYINLANCYAIKGDLEIAESLYKKSIELNPLLASAYYNLSMLARESYDFKLASEYFEKAGKIDFNLTFKPPYLINESITTKEMFNLFISKALEGIFNIRILGLILFESLLIGLYYYMEKDKYKVNKCPKCGKVYCIKCEEKTHKLQMCSECFKMTVSPKVKPTKKIEYLLKIYKYQNKKRDILYIVSWFLPAVILEIGGKPFLGVSLSFLLFMFLNITLLSLIFDFNLPFQHGINWIAIISFLFFVIIYVYIIKLQNKIFKKGILII